jgi:hypothetical protein
MSRIRFTIASLLAVVLLVAVGFAALRESDDLWDSGVFTLTLGVLLVSVHLALHRTDSRRTFWIGCALCGWGYLGLSLVPSIESRLITTKALSYLDSRVPGRSEAVYTIRLPGTGSGSPGMKVRHVAFTPEGRLLATSGRGHVRLWDAATGKPLGGWNGTTENFVRIGHCLFALVAAWFGGQLSRRLCRNPGAPDSPSDSCWQSWRGRLSPEKCHAKAISMASAPDRLDPLGDHSPASGCTKI